MTEPPKAPKPTTQLFEVVMLKNGVSDLTALEGDFQRVKVTAADPISALMSKEVEAVKGFRPLFTAPPGVPTEPEIMARRRSLEGPPVDKSKI